MKKGRKMKQLIIAAILQMVLLINCSPTEPNGGSNGTDTTSHNFSWQSYSFGGGGGDSGFKDVAVISENNIWAVGEIYLKDSLGNDDPLPYNAAHWDGSKWTPKRIEVRDFGTAKGYYQLRAVFAFSENNIWFGSFADLIKWDGQRFQPKAFFMKEAPFNGQINKIWGKDENNIYCAGNGGSIYYYKGNDWERLNSGIEIDVQDIWGGVNKTNGETEILAVASNIFFNEGMKLLKIKNNIIDTLKTKGLSWSMSGVWFEIGAQYYAVGDGIFQKNNLEEELWKNKPLDFTNYYTYRIRGNGYNDIIVAGSQGEILHNNGKSWKSYQEETKLVYGNYESLSIKRDVAAAVGYDSGNAIVTIGKRIK